MPNPPSVHHWLIEHPAVSTNVIWETPQGLVEPYLIWPSSRIDDLQHAFAQAWKFGSVALTDPPPNVLHPGDNEVPTTTLAEHDARWLYLASVGQSLAIEIGTRVPVAHRRPLGRQPGTCWIAGSSTPGARPTTATRSTTSPADTSCRPRRTGCTRFSRITT